MAGRVWAMRRALAWLGLLGVVVGAGLLATLAASEPTGFVPAHIHGGFPSWLSGPLHDVHLGRLTTNRFQVLLLTMSAAYGAVLVGVRSLSLRAVMVVAIVANVLLALGPVLLSQDLFGYVSFARLGALHHLNPYTHVSADIPGDAVYNFLGWRTVESPYGPLFTIASYAAAPLGVAGAVWSLKALAAAASVATVWLVARAAAKLGRPAATAAAFVGLSPVLLVLAVGGAHNDTLLVALLAAALLLSAGAQAHWGRAAGTLAVAVGVKLTAGLMLAFLVLAQPQRRERLRTLGLAVAALAAVAGLAYVVLGSSALGFTNALRGQQQMVATHSVPNETARLVGLPSVHGLPGWWRDAYVVGFVLVLAIALWRTHRGTDWRVAAGWVTLALLISTAWLLPWYAIWILPLAAVVEDRRLRAAALAISAYAVLIRLPLATTLLGGRRS